MPYLVGERDQNQLFPASIEEYIGPDDPVRAYDAFVEQVDFAYLGIELDEHQVGPPEFDPRAMVKLLVYGYSYGIRSSRKLERDASQCELHMADRWPEARSQDDCTLPAR